MERPGIWKSASGKWAAEKNSSKRWWLYGRDVIFDPAKDTFPSLQAAIAQVDLYELSTMAFPVNKEPSEEASRRWQVLLDKTK